MKFEVEKKFRVDDISEITQRILSIYGGETLAMLDQTDWYFQHPARDFAETDEALRVRYCKSKGETKTEITWKGPRLNVTGTDAGFKTRQELNIALDATGDSVECATTLFQKLGFRLVFQLQKTRTVIRTAVLDRSVEFALDRVRDLGAFLEIEIVSQETELEVDQQVVLTISDTLGLTKPITDSYLELLQR